MATATYDFAGTGELATPPWLNQESNFTMSGGVATPMVLASDVATVYTSAPLNALGVDIYAQVALPTTTGGSAGGYEGAGVVLRWTSGAKTGYRIVVNAAATNNVSVARFVGGVFTGMLFRTQAFGAGDVLRVEVTGPANNAVIKVFRAAAASPTTFAQLGADFTDTSNTIPASGFVGVGYSGTMTAATIDNWEGGDLVTAPPLTPVYVYPSWRKG